MIGVIVILGFAAAMFWLAAVNPRGALLAMIFLLPWGMLAVDFGLIVSAYQIVVLALIVTTALRSLYGSWNPPRVAAAHFLGAFVLFAILTSLVQIGFAPDVELNVSGARTPTARAITQLFMFVFTVSPAVLVAWGIRTDRDITDIARTYIISVLVLGVIGWGQLAVWYATGSNPIPISIVNSLLGGNVELTEGYVPFGDLTLHRMNSLAGEPRTMGAAAIFAMLIIQAVAATHSTVPRWKLVSIWLFLAVTVLGTFSTSAMLLWGVGSLLQFPLAILFGARLRISMARILTILVAIMLPFAIAIAAVEASGLPIIDILASRTIDRLGEQGAVEDFDLAIIDYLKDHPGSGIAGVGLGNAHLYAMPYLRIENQWYALGQVFVAKTNYLRLISESGIIGLALFLTWYVALLIEASAAIRSGRAAQFMAIIPVATVTLTLFLASGYNSELCIVAGLLSGVVWIGRRSASVAHVPGAPAAALATA